MSTHTQYQHAYTVLSAPSCWTVISLHYRYSVVRVNTLEQLCTKYVRQLCTNTLEQYIRNTLEHVMYDTLKQRM